MKKFILFLASTASVLSFAGNATLFHCQGEDGTTISYSTTSFIGKPQMNVTYKGEQVRASGLVATLESPVGTLATVTDNHLVPVDGPMVRYTLIVPQVKLDRNNNPEEFKTTLIRTSVVNAMFGPQDPHGPMQHNQAEEVTCKAQYAVF